MAGSGKNNVSDVEIGIAPDVDVKSDGAHPVEVEVVANANRPNARKEAPVSVARLSPEERVAAERALVRKIDLRLLPMIILMYILNYLDRMIASCPRGLVVFFRC